MGASGVGGFAGRGSNVTENPRREGPNPQMLEGTQSPDCWARGLFMDRLFLLASPAHLSVKHKPAPPAPWAL